MKSKTLNPFEVKSKVVSVEVETYTGQGLFEVHVYYRGVEVTATVKIVNPNTGQEIATYVAPSDFPVWLNIGGYLAYAYYDNYEASQTVEIKEGQTTIWRVYMQPKVCFIATACYGYGHPALKTFRWFRDSFLKKNIFGLFFIKIYYFYLGAPISHILKKQRILRLTAKTLLNFVLHTLRWINHGKI